MLCGIMAGNVKIEKMQVIPIPSKDAVNLEERAGATTRKRAQRVAAGNLNMSPSSRRGAKCRKGRPSQCPYRSPKASSLRLRNCNVDNEHESGLVDGYGHTGRASCPSRSPRRAQRAVRADSDSGPLRPACARQCAVTATHIAAGWQDRGQNSRRTWPSATSSAPSPSIRQKRSAA
jgi:hypothetical protein